MQKNACFRTIMWTDYIVCQSRSADEARTIEGYFQELGASGFNGGGNDTSSIVYAYRKRGYTIE